ncbi:MAG: mannitol dehydrogenase family protein, partial [Litorivicinus sp.]
PVEPENGALIACLSRPEIRIAALTVTEGGYYVDSATGQFDAQHADIQFDAANPATPKTAFGAIVAALRLRRDSGAGPMTAQSCDNLQGNGAVLRQTVVGLARLSDPELAAWIDANCSFPNSMVDCIVPATGARELELAKTVGVNDAAPVTHENFRQWVIEDDFCAGRPDWDKVGAQFTSNVHDFEMMKIRILNGGHQVISVPGELLSVESISGCMQDADIRQLFVTIAQREVAPHVKAVPNMTPDSYIELIHSRFSNPKIVDTTRRVAFDGSSRHPGFILPTVREGIAAGQSIRGLALVEAAWARMCAGTREDGSLIEANDPNWAHLNAVALQAKDDPAAWLAMTNIYGDLGQNEAFSSAFAHWLTAIWKDGTRAAIQAYCV